MNDLASVRYEFRPFKIADKCHRWTLCFIPSTRSWSPTLYWQPIAGAHWKLKTVDKETFKAASIFKAGGLAEIIVTSKIKPNEAVGKTLLSRKIGDGRWRANC